MTARQLVDSPVLRVAIYALALGIAWAELKASVNQKADKVEVQAVDTRIQAIAHDISDIKSLLCANRNSDSYCQSR